MKPTPTALNGSSRSVNARLADVEPTVEALLSRCDELLLAGKALAARVAQLEDRCHAMDEGSELSMRCALIRIEGLEAWTRRPLWQQLRSLVGV